MASTQNLRKGGVAGIGAGDRVAAAVTLSRMINFGTDKLPAGGTLTVVENDLLQLMNIPLGLVAVTTMIDVKELIVGGCTTVDVGDYLADGTTEVDEDGFFDGIDVDTTLGLKLPNGAYSVQASALSPMRSYIVDSILTMKILGGAITSGIIIVSVGCFNHRYDLS